MITAAMTETSQSMCEACGAVITRGQPPEQYNTCTKCLVRWAHTLETTVGRKRDARQRHFAFGDRKAWLTKSASWSAAFALKGESAATETHNGLSLRDALCSAAGWLRGAKALP